MKSNITTCKRVVRECGKTRAHLRSLHQSTLPPPGLGRYLSSNPQLLCYNDRTAAADTEQGLRDTIMLQIGVTRLNQRLA